MKNLLTLLALALIAHSAQAHVSTTSTNCAHRSTVIKHIPFAPDIEIDRFSLTLFRFDSPDPGILNLRIMKEFIYPCIREGSKIDIHGYGDIVGLDDRNMKLSWQRAEAVAKLIKRNVKSKYASLSFQGHGETTPLFDNATSEGRSYNRTVQIIITSPVKEKGRVKDEG